MGFGRQMGKALDLGRGRRILLASLAADHERARGRVADSLKRGAGEHSIQRLARLVSTDHRICGSAADSIDEIHDWHAGDGGELLERDGGIARRKVEGSHFCFGTLPRDRCRSQTAAGQGGNDQGHGNMGRQHAEEYYYLYNAAADKKAWSH
jgi:hypothetical protein